MYEKEKGGGREREGEGERAITDRCRTAPPRPAAPARATGGGSGRPAGPPQRSPPPARLASPAPSGRRPTPPARARRPPRPLPAQRRGRPGHVPDLKSRTTCRAMLTVQSACPPDAAGQQGPTLADAPVIPPVACIARIGHGHPHTNRRSNGSNCR